MKPCRTIHRHHPPHGRGAWRPALAAAGWVAWLILSVAACTRPERSDPDRPRAAARPQPPSDAKSPPSPEAYQAPDARGFGRAAGLLFLERLHGGAAASERVPMVVVIHGLGDRAHDRWLAPADVPMRVVMPQAPTPHANGFSWFPYRAANADAEVLARGIATATEQLARALVQLMRHRPTAGKPIVTGFSQGGMLSYALALAHPELVGFAHPMAGALPKPLWPRTPPPPDAPAIRAIHGDADSVVPFALDRALQARLSSLGYDARLQVRPGVGHQLDRVMAARLRFWVTQQARRQAARVAE